MKVALDCVVNKLMDNYLEECGFTVVGRASPKQRDIDWILSVLDRKVDVVISRDHNVHRLIDKLGVWGIYPEFSGPLQAADVLIKLDFLRHKLNFKIDEKN